MADIIDFTELQMIEDTPLLNDLQIEFYKTMLTERKQKILDYSYNLLKH